MTDDVKPTNASSRHASQDRQASLISSAANLFAAKGFKGTTTKEIAKAAGVSEALVFKYFPTSGRSTPPSWPKKLR